MGVFIDLKKAFDTIDYGILQKKMERYGVRGAAMTWLQSCISNRKQFVQLGNLKSKSLNITCGSIADRGQSWDPNYSFYTPMIFGKCLIFFKHRTFKGVFTLVETR